MKKDNTPELLLDKFYNSSKIKKAVIVLVIAGIIMCVLSLLPPVQNILFSFIDRQTSNVYAKTSGTFSGRLQSMLSLAFFALLTLLFTLCCLFSKIIGAFFEKKKNAKILIFAGSLTIVCLLLFITVISYRNGWQWLDGDHSSEMVLGEILAKENTLVTSSWHYSTEIRLIYQTIFTMPLFKIFGSSNWALIRALNILLNNITLILSYIFFARQIKMQPKWICLTSLFLILPVSHDYWDIVIFGGYYIFFLIQIFCCLGLYIKLTENTNKAPAIIPFVLFSLLSFALGLQGIRSPLCVHIPLLISSIYLYTKSSNRKKFPLFLGCYAFFLGCLGFAGNNLLHFKYSFASFDAEGFDNQYNLLPQKFSQAIAYFAELFGLSSDANFISAQGIFNIIILAGVFFMIWHVIKVIRISNTEKSSGHLNSNLFTEVFFLSSMATNFFITIIKEGGISGRYFIPFWVLYIPLAGIAFQYSAKKYDVLKRTALITGITIFLFGQTYFCFQNLKNRNINAQRSGYISYLIDNNLNFGFGTHWNAHITTELTSGKIDMAGLNVYELDTNDKKFALNSWLNPTEFYDPSNSRSKEASFLLLTYREWELSKTANRPFSRMTPDYRDDSFIVLKFPTAEIIYQDILDN